MNKSQAMAYSRREVALLKQEGYTKGRISVYDGELKNLSPIKRYCGGMIVQAWCHIPPFAVCCSHNSQHSPSPPIPIVKAMP